MSNIKGLIISAGYGTRFLPITKTFPKEMFPILERPAIDFIISEFINSGIEDILMVTSRRKRSIEEYFEINEELYENLKNIGKFSEYKKALTKFDHINIHYIRQKEMKGTAHAIYLAKSFIANDPFVVAYPDDIFMCEIPLAKQLISEYKKTDKNVLAIMDVPKSETYRYGIIEPEYKGKIMYIKNIVEKPNIIDAPSTLMSAGRYLFKADIMNVIEKLINETDIKKEISQTPAILKLAKKNDVIGHIIEGERLDTGQPKDYIKSIIKYVLNYSKFSDQYLNYLKTLITELN